MSSMIDASNTEYNALAREQIVKIRAILAAWDEDEHGCNHSMLHNSIMDVCDETMWMISKIEEAKQVS